MRECHMRRVSKGVQRRGKGMKKGLEEFKIFEEIIVNSKV
jgi:hypothetical protein